MKILDHPRIFIVRVKVQPSSQFDFKDQLKQKIIELENLNNSLLQENEQMQKERFDFILQIEGLQLKNQ